MPRKAQLHAVREREGNTQRRPIPKSVKLPPAAPSEPDWAQPFPRVPQLKKPGPAPRAPARPPKGASEEETTAHRLARLAWMMDLYAHHEEVRAFDGRKRLQAEALRCRRIAREVWRAIVPILDAQGLLATADAGALKDHCVLQARIDQGERDITTRGTWVEGERGAVKNPSTTFVNQCRDKDRPNLADFGLTPGARDKLNPRGDGDDDGDGLFD